MYRTISLLLLALFLLPVEARAQRTGNCTPSIGEGYLDINNVRARIPNNGMLFWRGDPYVYEVPKGGGEGTIFASGIWLGGYVNGQLRTAASTYGPYEYWAGPLDDAGNPPANCSEYDQVWKVSREDVIAYEGSGVATPDLTTWPTGLGAPTLDANGDTLDLMSEPFETRKDRVINLAAGERPAILGDQMIWWVMNDRGNTHNRTGTPPIGVEVHVSAFAFNTSGAIGNTTFYKYRLFYKGANPLEQAYMGIFSDPDLGNFDDDYVGSDSTLGLGYVYNADNNDEGHYGEAPPATGYDFFQGPLVDTDGVDNNRNGTVDEPGERLQMTTFVYYNNGGTVQGDPADGGDFYDYMRGRWRDGQPITFGGDGRDFSDTRTSFMFPGDPVTQSFWTELNADGNGTANEPADRRFVMATGPFTINPGDVQEIVFGIVWSRAESNLASLAKLREDDALAQAVFDVNFQLPPPPAAPRVEVTELDKEVIIEWGYNPTDNNYLESYAVEDILLSDDVSDRDLVFEGYEVYQYASPQDQRGRRIATYDVANGITRVIEGEELTFVTAEGTDSGVQTFHRVSGLTNYRTYYFGVAAYAYNETSGQKVYRGPTTRFEATPSPTRTMIEPAAIEYTSGGPGLEVEGAERTYDFVAEKDGVGGGYVAADVVNPAKVTGHQYRVDFEEVEFEGEAYTVYNVTDVTTGEVKFNGTSALQATGQAPRQGQDVLRLDGLSFSISGPAPAFLAIQQTNAAGEVIDGNLVGSLNARPNGDEVTFIVHGNGASDNPSTYGRIDWRGNVAARAPIDYEIRFVENPEVNGQMATTYYPDPDNPDGIIMKGWVEGVNRLYDEGDSTITEVVYEVGRLPFQVWEIDPRTGAERQVNFAILDDDGDQLWDLNQPARFGIPAGYERIYAFTTTYDESAFSDPITAAQNTPQIAGGTGDYTIGRVVFAPYYSPEDPSQRWWAAPPSPGTNIRFATSKPNLPGDTFTFSTEGLGARAATTEERAASLEMIGMVPNPYRGASAYEVSHLSDVVRFTGLPDVPGTIRVFTLNGTLVRTLEFSGATADLEWNLLTEDNLPIASGMYLIHVDVPEVGEKVIKFGVVKKRPQLNAY